MTKPTKLGWIAVKNRSQPEIDAGVSLPEARSLETSFFENHQVYSALDKSLYGVTELTKKLTRILANRIQYELPSIQKEVKNMLRNASNELKQLGDTPPSTEAEMRQVFVNRVMVRSRKATSLTFLSQFRASLFCHR